MSLAALGVVYGDIGTSPLYAFREALGEAYGLEPDPVNVFGVLSLIFWSLIIVISIKYIVFVMRADNDGEGGILALTALITPPGGDHRGERRYLILLGLFGTALLYGDGAITPAISVLSAVEGLAVATPVFDPYVIPIAAAILIGLFAVQSHGTARVGAVFGPVMVVWFATLGALGISQITRHPDIIGAVLPTHAVEFFASHPLAGFLSLGSVFLVVTGGEALYADLGHFGVRPIRWAWFGLVLPGLMLNYLGQGALLLSSPTAVDNPFFRMAPEQLLIPLVVLSTVATVIASQALISGAFSLTMQAIHLDYLPRMRILHTSTEERGQVYLAGVNWMLLIACLGLVAGFRSSSALAAAYGVAVTTTMVVTTLLFYVLIRRRWQWRPATALALAGGFLLVDVAFFGANLVKIPAGGWFPLVAGMVVYVTMTTWRRGRHIVYSRIRREKTHIDEMVDSLRDHPLPRVPGTAVYMFPDLEHVPPALISNLRANHAVHETVVLLAVRTVERPRVLPAARARFEDLGDGFYRGTLTYGFADQPDVPTDLSDLVDEPACDPEFTTYFIGRETVRSVEADSGMARWRERLFALLHRNAASAADYFQLPPSRVVEIGSLVNI